MVALHVVLVKCSRSDWIMAGNAKCSGHAIRQQSSEAVLVPTEHVQRQVQAQEKRRLMQQQKYRAATMGRRLHLCYGVAAAKHVYLCQ